MADSHSQLVALEAFIKAHPSIRFTSPTSPDYTKERQVWSRNRREQHPLAIVHPQSADDLSALVKFAGSERIKFTIRGGGHNLQGLAVVEGALVIDMRATFRTVTVAADRASAVVQGGALLGEVVAKLWETGLATPVGNCPTVGYVGWATYGGYGPFTTKWGLGVDQILGATVVNASGDIVTADEELLKGIRGAGGAFGVILDVTIKVYPLKSLLAGAIFFDSQDISKTVAAFNIGFRSLLNDGIPPETGISQIAVNAPPGRLFGVSFVWSSEDIETGLVWCAKIASLGTVLENTVTVTTIPDWLAGIGAMLPLAIYGKSTTHSLRALTPEAIEVVGLHLAKMPSDPATMFCVHHLRMGPSASSTHAESVFATREPHYLLEMLGYASQKDGKDTVEEWTTSMWRAVQEVGAEDILPTPYISLDCMSSGTSPDVPLARHFGPHAREIVDLKRRVDPESVFSLTVPRLP